MAELLTAQSVAKGVQYAPRKVSLVAGLVRGRTVADAMIILEHTPKRAAKIVAKAISSAKANATNTHGIDEKDMFIETLIVSAGPRLKRYRPAAHGRALPFQKKTSHITVIVAGNAKKKPAPKAAAATATVKSTTDKPAAKKTAAAKPAATKPKKETK